MKPTLIPDIARAFLSFYRRKPELVRYDFNIGRLVEQEFDGFDSLFGKLVEWGGRNETVFLRNTVLLKDIPAMMREADYPFLLLTKDKQGVDVPVLFEPGKSSCALRIFRETGIEVVNAKSVDEFPFDLIGVSSESVSFDVVTCFPANDFAKNAPPKSGNGFEPYRLLQRFFLLLAPERREIFYILLYAVMIGLIGLSLPLGVQSLVGFVSSGQIMTSVIVLIAFILAGVLASGIMTVMQLHLVEYIHQRLFSKTAFSFAFRIPRIRLESVMKFYPPELMNRFFDTLTLMKGMSVVLIDFFSAILQTVFGMVLLSLYHPLFLVVGVLLILILGFIIRITGPKGLKTALKESAFKYMTANWLEEIARSLGTFKLAGKTNFALEKTDHYVSNYIQAREEHFSVLKKQYYSFVIFKTFITAMLLILGAVLITQREINLGQFVAAEIIIILVIQAIEKIILKLDTVYDVLVSVEKITDVTELPVETYAGLDLPVKPGEGITVSMRDLSYRYPDRAESVIDLLNLDIPAGQNICIAGPNGSGKTTLAHLIIGLYDNYTGSISYNGISLRDLNKASLLDHLGDYVSQEGIFDGSVLENIVIGRPNCSLLNVQWAIEAAGLSGFINGLPEGLNTRLIGGNVRISDSVARKIIIARNIVERPSLLVLDDFLLGVERREKRRILELILSPEFSWTVILISNDPMIMSAADRLILMQGGRIEEEGKYSELKKNSTILQELLQENSLP